MKEECCECCGRSCGCHKKPRQLTNSEIRKQDWENYLRFCEMYKRTCDLQRQSAKKKQF